MAEPIAIIGIGCRFPGADGPRAFWRLLADGVNAISEVPSQRWDAAAYYDPQLSPGTMNTRRGGFLKDVDAFDASFFGISPREAIQMDPQQRLLLEKSCDALQDAGYALDEMAGSATGVFVGMCYNDYQDIMFRDRAGLDLYTTMGGSRFAAAGRLSFVLDLEGPSIVVDTACSSSLVAVHLACQSLRTGECTMALAGGVNLILQPHVNICLAQGKVLAPDGHCKFGDAAADGYARSEGVGVVVLKPLSKALADRDPIYAVILATAVNHKGKRDGGLVTPSPESLKAVMQDTYARAGVSPGRVQYVEAHGTGTPRGDAVELPALGAFMGAGRDPDKPCLVGSVKSNIGHSESASGVAGLIKVALALCNRKIPPSLHLKDPNPQIPWDELPLEIPTTLRDWPEGSEPARAGFNSFGISGTNAHAVLEEAPQTAPNPRQEKESDARGRWQLLVTSARTRPALEATSSNLARHLQTHPDQSLADIAYTCQIGRQAYEHRSIVVCCSHDQAVDALGSADPKLIQGPPYTAQRPVAFMFSGLGDHYVGMGLGLYQSEPVFRESVDRCARLLEPLVGEDIRQLLYPDRNGADNLADLDGGAGGIDLRRMVSRNRDDLGRLGRTSLAQPALFVIEYALATLWMDLGIHPDAMIGHSLGEYVAACVAGVFSLPDALRLVCERGRLIQELEQGAMLAIGLSEDQVQPHLTSHLSDGLSLAAVNAPSLCVASGPLQSVERLQARLETADVVCQRLPVEHAFHSAMMEPVGEALAAVVAAIDRKPPTIAYVSNLTGTWIRPEEATDPHYWARHLCRPVRFADGLRTLTAEKDRILLEIGPGQSLGAFAAQQAAPPTTPTTPTTPMPSTSGPSPLASLRHVYDRQPDHRFFLETLGRLWLAGTRIDWPGLYRARARAQEPRRVRLPTYPFQRTRYWIKTDPLTKRDPADWFYAVTWTRSDLPGEASSVPGGGGWGGWLIFEDEAGLSAKLLARLQERGEPVVTVRAAETFAKLGERRYAIDAARADDYEKLLGELIKLDGLPRRVVHAWSVTGDKVEGDTCFQKTQERGFESLLYLAQALGSHDLTERILLGVLTEGVCEITGDEPLRPDTATILGPCRVIPQENPQISCRAIDCLADDGEEVIDGILAEMTADTDDGVVAYRAGERWVRGVERVSLAPPKKACPPLRERGVYLITGGLGGLGLAIAEHLARSVRARLVLVGRSGLPPRQEWPNCADDRLCRRIERVEAIEAAGGEVLVAAADVAQPQQLKAVVQEATARFGPINGVVHAAGVAGAGLIQLKSAAEARRVMEPKVGGARSLQEVFSDTALDFLVLFSSTTALVGGLGQVDYCAANCFLDLFARDFGKRRKMVAISINWGPWQWDDWQTALTATVPRMQAHLAQVRQKTGISFAEGAAAFATVLASPLSQVIVSPQDLNEVIEEHARGVPWADAAGADEATHGRPPIPTPFVAPSTEIQKRIAGLWAESLGIDGVGIHDNFFELGGHSLIGMRLLAGVRTAYGVVLGMRSLFEHPTISDLARLIEETLLGEVERMPDDEARRLLQELKR